MTMMISILVLLMIPIMLLFLCSIVSKNWMLDREKLTPFECGFDPMSSPRIPFSLQFFLIMVIFMIFDIEIIIMIPGIMMIQLSNIKIWLFSNTLFMVILMLGLYYEWYKNILNWSL